MFDILLSERSFNSKPRLPAAVQEGSLHSSRLINSLFPQTQRFSKNHVETVHKRNLGIKIYFKLLRQTAAKNSNLIITIQKNTDAFLLVSKC